MDTISGAVSTGSEGRSLASSHRGGKGASTVMEG